MSQPSAHPPYLRPVPGPAPQPPLAGELEARARTGDVNAWAALYEIHYEEVFRQLRYLCGDPAMAEELAQETFAQGMASCRHYDGRRPFAAWMHGIALNVVRHHWRKSANRSRAMQRYEHSSAGRRNPDDPDGSHLRSERSRVLYAVLEELPERWREAFVLREIQGLSSGEVAARLGISASNVAVRVTRARARIREELARRGWLGEDTGGALP